MSRSRGKVAIIVLSAVTLLILGLFRVNRRHQVIRLGYELNEARANLRVLQEENNRLSLEESVLTNPQRIEQLAKALGMKRPTPDQIQTVNPSASSSIISTP